MLTLNCELRLDGSNVPLILKTVLDARATVVCLQEVTIPAFEKLVASKVLAAAGYQVYGNLDQGYVQQKQEAVSYKVYGLCFLTRVELVDFW